MGWGGLVALADLITLVVDRFAGGSRYDREGRRVELIDEDFGTVVGRRHKRVWRATTSLRDPDVEADVILSGKDGPSRASRRRALAAIADWSELASGPFVAALAKRTRRSKRERGPFREGAPTEDLLERHPPVRVSIDARRAPTRLKVKVAGHRWVVRLKLPHDA